MEKKKIAQQATTKQVQDKDLQNKGKVKGNIRPDEAHYFPLEDEDIIEVFPIQLVYFV